MLPEFALGWALSDEDANRLSELLRMSVDVAFSRRYVDGCTVFKAGRKLGETRYLIAKAIIDGYRLGVFS